ncbi:MAG: MoxR family ATPase [Chloroflexi bacterium]|nr:MoxR family ATPase [Chloroflexota bacterium]
MADTARQQPKQTTASPARRDRVIIRATLIHWRVLVSSVQPFAQRLAANIERVIVGKQDAVELALIGLLSQGHLLIEDVPGVGKTMLARSLARSLGCSFSRIQFTPDMLPSDVTGVSIFNQESRHFEYRAGPLMAQIVLADEINRATPKTQSALLEAMEERQTTVDGVTHMLPRPFMVLATQNPIEHEGTFPLPEAQLDRFLLRVRLGYPGAEEEINVLERQQFRHPFEELAGVASVDELSKAQTEVREVHVASAVKRYAVDLTRNTRGHSEVYLGASPRGSLALYRAGQARAAIHGRDYVLPDDVKALAAAVLAHRIILSPGARLRELTAERVVQELVTKVPVPGGEYKP